MTTWQLLAAGFAGGVILGAMSEFDRAHLFVSMLSLATLAAHYMGKLG